MASGAKPYRLDGQYARSLQPEVSYAQLVSDGKTWQLVVSMPRTTTHGQAFRYVDPQSVRVHSEAASVFEAMHTMKDLSAGGRITTQALQERLRAATDSSIAGSARWVVHEVAGTNGWVSYTATTFERTSVAPQSHFICGQDASHLDEEDPYDENALKSLVKSTIRATRDVLTSGPRGWDLRANRPPTFNNIVDESKSIRIIEDIAITSCTPVADVLIKIEHHHGPGYVRRDELRTRARYSSVLPFLHVEAQAHREEPHDALDDSAELAGPATQATELV